eukprot:scaffold1028_cov157-Skeletonema_menzelii.AAC.3
MVQHSVANNIISATISTHFWHVGNGGGQTSSGTGTQQICHSYGSRYTVPHHAIARISLYSSAVGSWSYGANGDFATDCHGQSGWVV